MPVHKASLQPKSLIFRALSGAGAQAKWKEQLIYIGSPALFSEELAINLDKKMGKIEQLQSEGKTVVILGDETTVYGLFAIRDNVRENSKTCNRRAYGKLGIKKVVMLTGDNFSYGTSYCKRSWA